jgi:hypothetical protein
MPWQSIVRKFDELSAAHADAGLRAAIVEAVADLETIAVSQLTGLLAAARGRPAGAGTEKKPVACV